MPPRLRVANGTPRRCGYSATLRGNLYALKLKASTAAARLVEFQAAVKGFGRQTLDLARLCHACTLPRWRRVRRRHARRRLRGAGGRPFFATLFSPSTARTVVSYSGSQKPGTIIISTAQRRLYLVLGNGQALSYAIGVGREGFSWSGATQISAKREWPDWTPPA